SMAELTAPVEVEVKIRYQFRPVAATVSPSETPGRARVEMHAPQLAVTPGQAAVFYRGEEVVGGGWISG
ncbi:MAG: tRNA 2-thiouridine(34) synthase MnmA, partial [Acidobacteria bacterium]|nr:tRNA 2-thiouridine(34) synthase MnmA [Acidobacteriota bacterium]